MSHWNTDRRTFLTVSGAALGSLMLPRMAAAQGVGATDFDSVLAKAKQEGSLIIRVTSPGRPETHQALIEAFKKRFGLNIQAEWTPISSVQTGTRVVSEAAGGRGSVDVIGSGGAEEVSVLLARELVKPYPWAQVFGKELPGIGAVADAAMSDLRGIALNIMDAAYGIGWNPNLIEEKDVPSRMMDLLDPRWSGKLAINAQFLIPYESLTHVYGPEKTLDAAKRLLDNKPVLERGTPAVSRAISVGQVPLGVTTFHSAVRAEKANEPQRFKLFSDYIPIYPLYVYVPETAPNPNAARLFAAWLVTEGAQITNSMELAPRLGDKEGPLGKMAAIHKDAKVLTPASLEQVKAGEPVRKQITQLIAR